MGEDYQLEINIYKERAAAMESRFSRDEVRITILSARQARISSRSAQALALTAQAMIMYNKMIEEKWSLGQ